MTTKREIREVSTQLYAALKRMLNGDARALRCLVAPLIRHSDASVGRTTSGMGRSSENMGSSLPRFA
jgi:hypothetical protein